MKFCCIVTNLAHFMRLYFCAFSGDTTARKTRCFYRAIFTFRVAVLMEISFSICLPPLLLADERGLADTGQLDDLCVGMVGEQAHRMVELFAVELGRTALAEIWVGGSRDGLALLRALDDHIALELRERQQHIAQQRVHRIVGQDTEIQHVDGDALVDHLSDETGCL